MNIRALRVASQEKDWYSEEFNALEEDILLNMEDVNDIPDQYEGFRVE